MQTSKLFIRDCSCSCESESNSLQDLTPRQLSAVLGCRWVNRPADRSNRVEDTCSNRVEDTTYLQVIVSKRAFVSCRHLRVTQGTLPPDFHSIASVQVTYFGRKKA